MASLKNKIAFIGLGQCGGNIACVANHNGYLAGAINTSEEDLKSISNRGVKNKLLLGNIGGCGKDRKVAKQIIKEEYTKVFEFIDTVICVDKEISLVYLCFSASGGTGSGFGPILLSLLNQQYPHLTFAAIVVMPDINESSISLFNDRGCMEELYGIDIPILIADNTKASSSDKGERRSREKIYNKVNESIIYSLGEFIKEREPSELANLDGRDAMKLLKTTGVQLISVTPLTKIESTTSETLANVIKSSFENNVFCPLEYDKQLKRAGFIYEIPESVSQLIDYDSIMSDVGIKKEIFEGIYPINEKTDVPKVISILTGLSYPETRIKQFDEALNSAMEKEKNIKKTVTSSLKKKDSSSFESFFDGDSSSSSNGIKDTLSGFFDDDSTSGKKPDVADILKNF